MVVKFQYDEVTISAKYADDGRSSPKLSRMHRRDLANNTGVGWVESTMGTRNFILRRG
jgi:hypothetical protein